ncbi:hypothetical protein LINGRAHAP2_LOCUS19547 [Linum grandiflorum]
MAGKRSRCISQSRSFGDTGVVLNRRPIQDQHHQKQRWDSKFTEIGATAAVSPDHSPPQGIFALSSIPPALPLSPPPPRKSERAEAAAHFLDRCFYCKKRLDHGQDIYMYGCVLCILYIRMP